MIRWHEHLLILSILICFSQSMNGKESPPPATTHQEEEVQVVSNHNFNFWPAFLLHNMTVKGNVSMQPVANDNSSTGNSSSSTSKGASTTSTDNTATLLFKLGLGVATYNCPITFFIVNTTAGFRTGLNFSTVFTFRTISAPTTTTSTTSTSTSTDSATLEDLTDDEKEGNFSFIMASTSSPSSSSSIEPEELSLGHPKLNLFAIDFFNELISVRINDNTTYVSPSKPLMKPNTLITVWIDYDAISNTLSISLSTDNHAHKHLEQEIVSFNLSVILISSVSVGFFANSLNSHQVLAWNFTGALLLFQPSTPTQVCTHILNCNRLALPLLIGGGGGALLFLAIGFLFLLPLYQRRKIASCTSFYVHQAENSSDSSAACSSNTPGILDLPVSFSYKELHSATSGFSKTVVVGRGAFGTVYKGCLPDRSAVAVKRFSETMNSQLQEEAFLTELTIIGRLRHRNLVGLKGWCQHKGKLLLVYDYMPNGSLDDLLHSKSDRPTVRVLSCKERYTILEGVVAALLYLHEEWEQQVLHRDVKPGNVLVDASFNARLGDFGLARLLQHSSKKLGKTTAAVGTLGYMAPELAMTGRATDKSDVYSFGMLALEVACGRSPLQCEWEEYSEGVILTLLDRVWLARESGNLGSVIDPQLRIDNEDGKEKMDRILQVGLVCTHPDPHCRPSMRYIQRVFQQKETSIEGLPAFRPVAVYSSPETPLPPPSLHTNLLKTPLPLRREISHKSNDISLIVGR